MEAQRRHLAAHAQQRQLALAEEKEKEVARACLSPGKLWGFASSPAYQ